MEAIASENEPPSLTTTTAGSDQRLPLTAGADGSGVPARGQAGSVSTEQENVSVSTQAKDQHGLFSVMVSVGVCSVRVFSSTDKRLG